MTGAFSAFRRNGGAVRFWLVALRAVLEISAVLAITTWATSLGATLFVALGIPLAAVNVLGYFGAAKPKGRLRSPALLMFDAVLFGLATAAIAAGGQPPLAAEFAALCLIDVYALDRLSL